MKKMVILGDGGHARVVKELCRALGCTDFATILREDEAAFLQTDPDDCVMALGIGMPSENPISGLEHRFQVARRFALAGFKFPPLVHPSVVIAPSCWVAEGAQVMAGSVLQPKCVIGNFAIVNTRASVDHDGFVMEGAHVAPGVILGGNVKVGMFSLVGIGATVLQGVTIGNSVCVAGGSMVIKDVAHLQTVMGVPACPKFRPQTIYPSWAGRSVFSDPMPEHGLA